MKKIGILGRFFLLLCFLFLYAPILVLVVFSFNASKSKAPFILIVGEEDMNNNAVSFRFRDGSQLNGVPVDEAKANILAVIKKRVQVNTAEDFKAALAD